MERNSWTIGHLGSWSSAPWSRPNEEPVAGQRPSTATVLTDSDLAHRSESESRSKQDSNRLIICDKCGQSFVSHKNLERHQKSVHGLRKGERVWVCQVPGCHSKVWTRFDNFKIHLERMHGSETARQAKDMFEFYDPDKHESANTAYGPSILDGNYAIFGDVMTISNNHNPISSSSRNSHFDCQSMRRSKGLDNVHPEQTDASDSDDDDASLHSRALSSRLHDQTMDRRPFFACPFYKAYPVTFLSGSTRTPQYNTCGTAVLKTIAALKQHLGRKHKKPQYYCPICFTVFTASSDRDLHLRARSCEVQSDDFFDTMISEDAWDVIARKTGGESQEESWYRIFGTIFPDRRRPVTPYQDNEVEAWRNIALTTFRALGPKAQEYYNNLQNSTGVQPALPPLIQAIVNDAFSIYLAQIADDPMIGHVDATSTDTRTVEHDIFPSKEARSNDHPSSDVLNQDSAVQALELLLQDHVSSTILDHIFELSGQNLDALISLLRQIQAGIDTDWLKKSFENHRHATADQYSPPPSVQHESSTVSYRYKSRKRRVTEPPSTTESPSTIVPPSTLPASRPATLDSEPARPNRLSTPANEPPTEIGPRRYYHGEATWEVMKPEIVRLYVKENLTLEQLMAKMKQEYNFVASTKQYKTHFKTWNISKYAPRSSVVPEKRPLPSEPG